MNVYVVVGSWCDSAWCVAAYESEIDAWHHATLASMENAALMKMLSGGLYDLSNQHDPEWCIGGSNYEVKTLPLVAGAK